MYVVTKQEFIDFDNAQPDDREFRLQDNEIGVRGKDCGCPMVHFGQAKGWDFNACGSKFWKLRDKVGGEVLIASFAAPFDYYIFNKFKTSDKVKYSELKKLLKRKELTTEQIDIWQYVSSSN